MSDEQNPTTNNINSGDEQSLSVVADKPNESEKIGNEYQEKPGGFFKEGNPGGGRPKETEEEREAKRLKKEILNEIKEEYKNGIIKELPNVSPALLAKAKGGDVQAIKEIHSLIFGNKTVMVGGDEDDEPLSVNIINYANTSTRIHPAELPTSNTIRTGRGEEEGGDSMESESGKG